MSALLLRGSVASVRQRARPPFVNGPIRGASSTARTGVLSSLRSTVTVGLSAAVAGVVALYYFDARSAVHRYIVPPILRYALDAETGHKLAVKVLSSGLRPKDRQGDDVLLKCEIFGKELSNPIGIAAGFDKDGEAIDGLLDLGFSWVEIGSVTPKPQPGNTRPRVFHLPEDSALINRYGFPSQGHAAVLSRLKARAPAFNSGEENASFRPETLLAVNLGKNKSSAADSIDDFVAGVKTFGPYADVLVINVSSPNTPGLRGLQNRDALHTLLAGVTEARDGLALVAKKKPLLVLKIAPDLTEVQLSEMAQVISENNVDGVIVSNTTTQRPSNLRDPNSKEVGGLSGAPLKEYSLRALRTIRRHLPASIPLIGCGGISSGADALEYAKAGASFVQIYTSFGYLGAGACRRIKDELRDLLQEQGMSWSETVRMAVKDLSIEGTSMSQSRDGEVRMLIDEAEKLNRKVAELARRLETDSAAAIAPINS